MAKRNPKNPASLLYWNDIEHDDKLNACSWAARGLWACKLLPIASRSPMYGIVIIGEHPCRWDRDLPALLAKASGIADPEAVTVVAATFLAMLTELVTSGAASVDNHGRIFNRRMVSDAKTSAERSRAGRKGASVTNASRQTGRQKSGKGVGKAIGNDDGKDPGKPVGKPTASKMEVKHDTEREIPDGAAPDARQNVGNGLDKHHGNGVGKTSASSYFSPNGDSMGGEPLQGSPPEETPSPVAARESAAGAPRATAIGRPRMAERLAALIEDRRRAVAT